VPESQSEVVLPHRTLLAVSMAEKKQPPLKISTLKQTPQWNGRLARSCVVLHFMFWTKPLLIQALEVAGCVWGEINLSFEISAFVLAATMAAEISLNFAGLPIGCVLRLHALLSAL